MTRNAARELFLLKRTLEHVSTDPRLYGRPIDQIIIDARRVARSEWRSRFLGIKGESPSLIIFDDANPGGEQHRAHEPSDPRLRR